MTQNGQLDKTDLRILDILQENSRMEVIHIASKVYKSPATTCERIQRLQARGFIERFTAVLNRNLVGRPMLMVAMVRLNSHAFPALDEFPKLMSRLDCVQTCLHLSGEFDFMLQVCLRDSEEYATFLNQQLCSLPMVEKVQSSLVLQEHKLMAALRLS